jgi:hypothetical protein
LSDKVHQLIFRTSNISLAFCSKLTQDASGFFWASQDEKSQDGSLWYTTTFRYLIKINETAAMELEKGSEWRIYTWEKLWFITLWKSPTSSTVLCFNFSLEMRE